MTENFQKNFGVILAFLAALFALLFFWTYQVYSLNAPTQWSEADHQFKETENHTERLITIIGFQGLIHNFKDYLIRGDEANKEQFFGHFEAAREELKLLQDRFGVAAEQQITTIEATLRNYFVNINKVDQLREEGKTVNEIDAALAIDDTAAFAALQALLELHDEEQAEIRSIVVAALEKDQSNLVSLYTTLFAIGLLLSVAVVMGLRFDYLKRRAVEKQSETKSLLESFLDNSTVPFLIADMDGRIRHCNLAAASLLDTQPRNLIGAAMSQILDLPASEPDIEAGNAPKSNTVKGIATVLELQDGKQIPVQADLTTNKDRTMQIVALFDQRSEIKMRERILLEAEQKLTKVTIDGGQAIRRDVQNFIDLIRRYVGQIKEVPLGQDKQEEYADSALAMAEALKENLAEYLPLSGPLADSKSVLELQDLTIEKFEKTVKDSLRMFERVVEEKNLTLNWVNRVPLKKETDFPAQLERILANLISNAVKYTAEDGAIKISTSIKDNLLNVKVEDTGIGIPAKDIPKIFEPGVRMQDAANMSRGQGIGLYSVRQSVRKLGGEITCSSYKGVGTDFVVKIPLHKV
ncbi:ATP-binding protein [Sneathiella marina]|uniref:histidine kinase n=1 Tax=Sneathiella marina TaxID=2950108 RepID=A0ABY4W7Z0_9PROT|nr:ATP-binding protein [Sneathiella marina]USG63142.1 ATP-binding protein [Sneathiella marina]